MNFKSILIFLLGVATGAGGMYLALHKKVENEINKELEKLDGNRKTESDQGDEDKNPVDKKPVNNIPVEISKPSSEELKRQYSEVLKKTDYTKAIVSDKVKTMTDSIKDQVDISTEKAKKELGETKKPKRTKVPKKVTQDEFDATAETGRMTLYYYADDILADDEDIKYDPVETMGATNLKNFKSTYDTIYIFNYATNMMYEIEYSNSLYADITGGDIDE